MFKKKRKPLPFPEGFSAEDIRIESSICTGEKTIGFYSRRDKRLHFAEAVKCNKDIAEFYEKYGVNFRV